MASVETEQVLVVPTQIFRELGYFQGFNPNVDTYLEELLSPKNTSYRPRSEMEEDPSFKQLIPYVVFQFADDSGQPQIFQYQRGRGQGEQRLHLKKSVGIGGHISSDDEAADGDLHPYQEGMRRELEEEVRIETGYRDRMVGLINDDETEVGKVHLGVVHLFEVDTPTVFSREEDIVDAGFRPAREIMADLEHFESWSQICLQALFGDA